MTPNVTQGLRTWSDSDVKTDKDGNVTGIEQKIFKAKDTDKDGEISDSERETWDKKKGERKREEAGGALAGRGGTPPDWDGDPHDRRPGCRFQARLLAVREKPVELHECVDGAGPL